MSITNTLKEGLRYPFVDRNKFLTLGILYTILSLISFYIAYLLGNSILDINENALAFSTNVSSNSEIVNIISSQISPDTLALVGVLSIGYILFYIYISGYGLRVVSNAINKDFSLPSFTKPLGMFVNGLKMLVVSIVYMIIPIIVISIVPLVPSFNVVLLLIGFILTIFMFLMEIMAINNMVVNEGKLGFAFKFNDIFNLISEVSWFRYVGGVIVMFLIIFIVFFSAGTVIHFISFAIVSLLRYLTVYALVETILLSLFIQPFLAIFLNYVCGSFYNERINDFSGIDEEYLI